MRGVMAVWAVAMAVAATTHAMVPGGGDADNDKLVLPDGYTTPAGNANPVFVKLLGLN